MKKGLLFIMTLCMFVFSVKAQDSRDTITKYRKNSTKVMGMFLTLPLLKNLVISQERFLNKNTSIVATWRYISIYGDNGGWHMNTVTLGTYLYFNSNKNDLRKYWISPYLLWNNHVVNSISTDAKSNFYSAGLAVGKRRYSKHERLFWDIGIGVSYGIGIYEHYREKQTDINSHSNDFGFLPKLIFNVGFKY